MPVKFKGLDVLRLNECCNTQTVYSSMTHDHCASCTVNVLNKQCKGMIISQNADPFRIDKLLRSAAEMYSHRGSRIDTGVTSGLSLDRPTEVASSPKIRQSLAGRPCVDRGYPEYYSKDMRWEKWRPTRFLPRNFPSFYTRHS
jgi:hypothetical protein